MSQDKHVRRLAAYAAYGSGALALLSAAFAGVLLSQAALVKRAIPRDLFTPPNSSGLYQEDLPGEPFLLAVLGDSSAAGLGAHHKDETPGGRLANDLAATLGRPVRLVCVAVVGAQSHHLHEQLAALAPHRPDAAVIMIGSNDVIRRARVTTAVRHLATVVRSLREQGTEVVVGTCPDVSSIEPLRQPLRWLAQRWCRDMAAAQTIAVVSAGGRTISLGDLLGDAFAQRQKELFSSDLFHPSAQGYALAAEVIFPSLLAALGHPAAPSFAKDPWTTPAVPRQGPRKLALAAAEAATTAGTEVAPATPEDATRGLWGELRNRLAKVADWVPENLLRRGRHDTA